MDISKYIVFQNENILALDKPSGWLSVYSRMGINDPRPCLSAEVEKPLQIRSYPVHRLDLEVSGLIIYAKNAATHRAWSQLFEKHEVQKTYHALTELAPEKIEFQKEQVWISNLVRGKKRTFEAHHGQWSKTVAIAQKIIDYNTQTVLFWHLLPVTGRSHQLRFHLTSHGYPILGDALYGSKISYNENAIALRAISLSLADPEKILGLGLSETEFKEKLSVKPLPISF